MALLRELRGPGQNAQLIGGEVTLLAPDDHAAALQAMLDHGRKPMSMSHGDFDYDYLERLALDPATGAPRFTHLSFAGHFDSMMFGRRGIRRARLGGGAAPLPRALRRALPAPRARARRHALPRPQHDGDATQPRPGRRRHPRLPRHGLPHVLLPARRVHGQREPLEGGLPRVLDRPRVGGDRARRRRAAALPRAADRRRALQPHRLRRLRRRPLRAAARRGRPRRPALAPGLHRGLRRAWTSPRRRALLAARLARGFARHPRALPGLAGWARRFVARAGGPRRMSPATARGR